MGNKQSKQAQSLELSEGGSVMVRVTQSFGYSHDGGVTVTNYEQAEEAQELPAEAAEYAVRTGRAEAA